MNFQNISKISKIFGGAISNSSSKILLSDTNSNDLLIDANINSKTLSFPAGSKNENENEKDKDQFSFITDESGASNPSRPVIVALRRVPLL